ncbi:hypothetical protein L596_018839 [Steinernema carpocapsae]|uniref:Secreted protein n=1 Tax=Steinernema carpocapsae TaxID=34508 RepID=A0A4U5N6J7_STECR|nr:hypothetical protein L596_018839 [Steinernema carpocapsae]
MRCSLTKCSLALVFSWQSPRVGAKEEVRRRAVGLNDERTLSVESSQRRKAKSYKHLRTTEAKKVESKMAILYSTWDSPVISEQGTNQARSCLISEI